MTPERVKAQYVSSIDQTELTIRLIEAVSDVSRPSGHSNAEIMADMTPQDREDWMRAARAAIEYLAECLGGAQRSS